MLVVVNSSIEIRDPSQCLLEVVPRGRAPSLWDMQRAADNSTVLTPTGNPQQNMTEARVADWASSAVYTGEDLARIPYEVDTLTHGRRVFQSME
jgi:hypothetical protein